MPEITYDRVMELQSKLESDAKTARVGEHDATGETSRAFFAGEAHGLEKAAKLVAALIDELYQTDERGKDAIEKFKAKTWRPTE